MKNKGTPTSVWFSIQTLKAFDKKRGLVSRSAIIRRLIQQYIEGKIEVA